MTLTTEQWKEILNAVNSSDGDILEQIKGKLKEQIDASRCCQW